MPNPRHSSLLGELFCLATKEVTAVLKHVLFMTLEEIVNKILNLWRICECLFVNLLKLDMVFSCKNMLLLNVLFEVIQIFLVTD